MQKILLLFFLIIVNLIFSQKNYNYSKDTPSLGTQNSSEKFINANAFEIELDEISLMDIQQTYGPVWNVIFTHNNNMIFTRGKNGGNEIVVYNLEKKNEVTSFRGTRLHAVSSNSNRIFYDNSIYDIKQRKKYVLNADIWNNIIWQDGNKAWLEDDYIISYKNIDFKGKIKPYSEKYLKLDLNDLQIKQMNANEINKAFSKLKNLNNNHKNFYLYLYSTSNIIIQDKKTPFSTSILYSKNGYPIRELWTSPNLEYLVVRKYSERYTNKYELLLYKLKYKKNLKPLYFKAINPNKWLGSEFKSIFNKTNGIDVWADVYEPKINPLNDKVIGANKNKNKGTIKIIKYLEDNNIGLMVGRYKKNLKKGDVITNFRKNNKFKDNNGAWVTIEEWDYKEDNNINFTKTISYSELDTKPIFNNNLELDDFIKNIDIDKLLLSKPNLQKRLQSVSRIFLSFIITSDKKFDKITTRPKHQELKELFKEYLLKQKIQSEGKKEGNSVNTIINFAIGINRN